MEFRATYRYARIAPRKLRMVLDLIRGKNVNDALQILRRTDKRAATMLDKTLRSAVANADQSLEADMESLWIKTAYIDGGPTRRRWRSQPRGRATVELRRTSHITIVVDDKK